MKKILTAIVGIFFVQLFSCAPPETSDQERIKTEDVLAWCIVPFDVKKRSPKQRIEMLKRLGISKYAYDWRTEHLKDMVAEWKLAKENNIEISAVWMWIDDQNNQVDSLSEELELVFQSIEESELKSNIWLSFHQNFFEGLSDDLALQKGTKMIEYIANRAEGLGCDVALYNHGDWFGEPENQIKIIETLPEYNLGIVYNFHHAHHQIKRFEELAKTMTPYLTAVNLNGMISEGPKILPIGNGTSEADMIKILLANGFKGPWGILGHVDDKDVEVILKNNILGLQKLHL